MVSLEAKNKKNKKKREREGKKIKRPNLVETMEEWLPAPFFPGHNFFLPNFFFFFLDLNFQNTFCNNIILVLFFIIIQSEGKVSPGGRFMLFQFKNLK